jgi:hypothetical protein
MHSLMKYLSANNLLSNLALIHELASEYCVTLRTLKVTSRFIEKYSRGETLNELTLAFLRVVIQQRLAWSAEYLDCRRGADATEGGKVATEALCELAA